MKVADESGVSRSSMLLISGATLFTGVLALLAERSRFVQGLVLKPDASVERVGNTLMLAGIMSLVMSLALFAKVWRRSPMSGAGRCSAATRKRHFSCIG